jgi:hypothetical protein
VLGREVEVHLHALQTMTVQFQLYEWERCHNGKLHQCFEMSGSWDAPDYSPCPHTPFQDFGHGG